jgi:hypothetical protein
MVHWEGLQSVHHRRFAGAQMVVLQPLLCGHVALGATWRPVDGVSLL